MGRKSNTNKLYISAGEWSQTYGGNKGHINSDTFQRLPFDCCALSFLPFEIPVCSPSGSVFDLTSIVPYIQSFNKDPVSGLPLTLDQLFNLNFTSSQQSEFMCPITLKVFTDNSHIVAIKTTGNVFSFDAIDKLNIKPKYWKDLLTDVPFQRSDIITIQDPKDLSRQDFSKFHHLNSEKESIISNEKLNEPLNALVSNISDGTAASSFTSSAMPITTKSEKIATSNDQYLIENIEKNKKAIAILKTNLGSMKIELYCSSTPKTCLNFINLAKSGFYRGIKFHRLVKNFMIQGGDPTESGTGGQSYFGQEFEDEFHQSLSHDSRGIISMANHGPNTNTSQFFIMFKECQRLDLKHTVFGKVVSGLEILDIIESINVDKKDFPTSDIILQDVLIIEDPFQTLKNKVDKKLKRKELEAKKGEQDALNKILEAERGSETIGKYMKTDNQSTDKIVNDPFASSGGIKKQKVSKSGFGDFSAW